MKQIVKGHEPASLTGHRKAPHADYGNYQDKNTLRETLVAEQRGLCCYCLGRIQPSIERMKIEHWHSQTRYRGEQLDYGNLLGACPGNQGQGWKRQHCDERKGEHDLSRNPAKLNHAIENLIRFEGDGTIVSGNEAFNRELNQVLNLNEARLRNNRKAVLDAFKMRLRKGDRLQRHRLERWLHDWNGDLDMGELRPYCQVIVYWLRKRLARS